MHWLKRDIWKTGTAIAGTLLLLALWMWLMVLIVLAPASSVDASERRSEPAAPVTGTARPTVDLTVTALSKEKLNQEVKQLQEQNDATVTASNKEKLQHDNNWLWSNGSTILSSFLSTLVVVGGALIGFTQWRTNRNDTLIKEANDRKEAQERDLRDREAEREKETAAQHKDLRAQAEERFKNAVTALGSDNEATQVGGAILLRSFLNPEDKDIYGRYYAQIFDLAVAYLRLSSTSQPAEDTNNPLPLTPLRQALIVVFKEAFPLARDIVRGSKEVKETLQSLSASGIQLDNAYLGRADLKLIWMPLASIQEANLDGADLRGAYLAQTNLNGTTLSSANLFYAYLFRAKLYEASLASTNLDNAVLYEADLSKANLSYANLNEASLWRANLSGANLSSVRNLEHARSLTDTDLRGVKGLTKDQLKACKAKGAIIDEDTTTNSSQPPVPSAQATTPPPSTDRSSSTTSQPSAEP